MRCPSCGVVYTLNPPSEQEMERYDKVNLKLKLGDSPSGLIGRLYYHVRNRMLRKKVKIVESQAYRTGGSLLNYGAKTGFFSHKMEKRGWKVTSVEKYHEERLFSLEMFHHRMIDVPEMAALHPGTFDVITMWHVFEHCHNPNELLDRFYELLRPGGILVMACPNICSTDAMFYGPYWAAYDVPRHLWHFNPVREASQTPYGFHPRHAQGTALMENITDPARQKQFAGICFQKKDNTRIIWSNKRKRER